MYNRQCALVHYNVRPSPPNVVTLIFPQELVARETNKGLCTPLHPSAYDLVCRAIVWSGIARLPDYIVGNL